MSNTTVGRTLYTFIPWRSRMASLSTFMIPA